ncbi:MAG: hypothetical protein QG608_3268 [Actinomycetota bacterium]|nr:hypothetical protein [Actinomycetota bacterium]
MTPAPLASPGENADPAPSSSAGSPSGEGSPAAVPARRGRRFLWPVTVCAVVLAFGVLSALLLPSSTAGDLDTDSAAPQGSRALARIMRREGIAVRQLRHSSDLASLDLDTTLLVVVHPHLLGPQQLQRIQRARADLLLVEPDSIALDTLAPQISPDSRAPDRDLAPGLECDPLFLHAAGTITRGGTLYQHTGEGDLCYPGDDGTSGQLIMVVADAPLAYGFRGVTVLGQADLLRNEHLDDEGNAAVAIGLLRGRTSLAWYLPDPAELSADGDAPSLLSLVPGRVGWSLALLAAVLVLLLLGKGRRLGPLVGEPLPVVVRSAEVQEGRARLYLRAGARPQAAAALRTAALRRMAGRLKLPQDSTVEHVIDSVATAAALPPGEVARVMAGSPPADDGELVRLAERLDTLERALDPAEAPPDPTLHRKADLP